MSVYVIGAGPTQIGGRNLLRNTSGEWKEHKIQSWGDRFFDIVMDGNPNLVIGDRITLQVDVDHIDSGGNDRNDVFLRIFFCAEDGSYTAEAHTKSIYVGQQAHFVIPGFVIPDKTTHFMIVLAHNVALIPTVRYRRWMLSKGSVPMDWTPAPEDILDRLAALEAAAGITHEPPAIYDGPEIMDDTAYPAGGGNSSP